ncbi:MAG TPA: YidB family protein [Actinospica sp.]|nr:YidB family protein [Actinospica sp.]
MSDILGTLLTQLTKNSGGINGLVSKLTSGGLGQQLQSWISQGQNQQVSGEQVRQALGEEQINRLAQQAGTTPDEAANQLAEKLPGAVDKLTPEGFVPQPDQLGSLLGKLTGKS